MILNDSCVTAARDVNRSPLRTLLTLQLQILRQILQWNRWTVARARVCVCIVIST